MNAPTAPPIADRFARVRGKRIAAAASLVGLAAADIPTDEQLAHLAWHLAAIEPSELQTLNDHGLPARSHPWCKERHLWLPDDLDAALPLPHPLDYEWRFEPRTRVMLARRCKKLAGVRAPIALLGTPTLGPALRGHAGRVLLLDSNAAVLSALARVGQLDAIQWNTVDIAEFMPPWEWQHRAAVVVCDPPWYPEGFATFLCLAAKLVRPAGTVLLSVPDPLTRPSAEDELEDLACLAMRLGFDVSSSEPHALRYRTPFFEYRALRAAGMRLVPLDWRAGTLWQLTSMGVGPAAPCITSRASGVSRTTVDVTFQKVRIRVLQDPTAVPGTLALQSLVPRDTMPTVSRRHPMRNAVNIWTSGNSVLRCADPELVGQLLLQLDGASSHWLASNREQLARDFASQHHLPMHDVRRALDQIDAIISREHVDRAAYSAAVYCDTPGRSLPP
jgi:hypothetical protein